MPFRQTARSTARKALRTAQVRFPSIPDRKYELQRTVRRLRRQPFERDFHVVSMLPGALAGPCLDVGANRGQSIEALQLLGVTGPITSFEPNPVLFERLQARYGADPQVTLHRLGLGAEDADLPLYVPVYGGYVFDGLASFDRSEAAEWLRDQLYFYRDDALDLQEHVCSLRRLDEFGLEPTFAKFDVQGFELLALQGAAATLRASEPILIIEWPADPVTDFLATLGYQPYTYEVDHLVPGIITGPNIVFLTERRASEIGRRPGAIVDPD